MKSILTTNNGLKNNEIMYPLSAFLLLLLVLPANIVAQEFKRSLFLGNSYTNYNNLPQLTANVALSAGDTLEVGSNMPGGYTFEDHLNNVTSMNLIAEGTWDFVVLQQQSQMPAFPLAQVEIETFPFATQLNDAILSANPCAETVFYMTWGRENGDQQNCANWPPVCTYEGMDDLLRERYLMMAEMNQGIVSPVGAVWRYLRENHPGIELFASDGSHPSPEGSYAAALAFYASIFRKSPLNTNYNYTIADSTEAIMRNAVHEVVYNQFSEWYIGTWDPVASGTIEWSSESQFLLVNTSANSIESSYAIDGGPFTAMMNDSILIDVATSGEHSIELVATACGRADTAQITFDFNLTTPHANESLSLLVFPNPASEFIVLQAPLTLIPNPLIVTDTKGSVIPCNYVFDGKHVRIDCSNWASGMYFLNFENDTPQKGIPIVVQRD
jgi:hypothetical protein